jgi:hypothetical protein
VAELDEMHHVGVHRHVLCSWCLVDPIVWFGILFFLTKRNMFWGAMAARIPQQWR